MLPNRPVTLSVGVRVTVLFAAGLTACAAVLAADEVTYQNAPEAGAPEASAPDAGLPETGAPDSTLPDAGQLDAATGACGHTFCEDFDGPNYQSHWSFSEILNGGSLTLDVDASLSPPASLHARAIGGARADLAKDFDGGYTTVTCTFALLADQIGNIGGGVDVLNIAAAGPPGSDLTNYNLSVHLTGGNGNFYEFGTFADGGQLENPASLAYPDAAAPFASWGTVTMQASLGAKASVSVFFGNDRVLDTSLTPPSPIVGVTVRVGATAIQGGSVPAEVHIDDVKCDLQ